jgi:type II secretory pathway component PulF
MEGMALILPGWGPALLNFALHRFCIAMRMTTEAALKMEQVMHYCFRATSNSAFQRGEAAAIAVMRKGGEVHEALASCGAPFPEEFLQSILVAEESGRMSEVMERLAGSYQEEASRRLKDAARYTSWAIYGLVCIFIIICIFSVASIYLGAIDNATRGI